MSVIVKNAKLNAKCLGCKAAKRALDGYQLTLAKAIKKIHKLSEENEKLKGELCKQKLNTTSETKFGS